MFDPMSGLEDLVREIHRRSIWKVLGIYLGGSWLVLEAIDGISETAGLPDWLSPFALILLLIGLPIVMATAFVQEGIPFVSLAESRSPEEGSVL